MVNTTGITVQASGNGVSTVFAYGNKFLDDSHLVVTLTDTSGNDLPQTLGIDYTVSGAEEDTGGAVTFFVAPISGYTVTITRSTPLNQLIDYIKNDDFPAETHERGLDKLTLLIQEALNRLADGLGSVLKYPSTEPQSTNNVVPSLDDRRSTNFIWDANSEPAAGAEFTGGAVINDSEMGGQNPSNLDAPSQESVQNYIDIIDPIGQPKIYMGINAPAQHVFAAGTIGNDASGADHTPTSASHPTQRLYIHMWDNFDNTKCPVSGGRGADALSDYNAGKTLTLPDIEGTVLAIITNMVGADNGRITVAESGLDGTDMGAVGGTQSVALAEAELPEVTPTGTADNGGAHTHSGSTNTTGDHMHNVTAVPSVTQMASQDGLTDTEAAVETSIPTTMAGNHSHTVSIASGGDHDHTLTMDAFGSDETHTNLQPTTMVKAIYRL